MKILSLLVCLILIISVGSSTAQNSLGDNKDVINGDVYVSPNGNDGGVGTITNPFRSLTKAISMVGDGATIHVANGIYTDKNLEITKNVNIVKDTSIPGLGQEAIIDAENTDQIFHVTEGIHLTLNGLVLTNGNAGESKQNAGGALDNEGDVTLIGCIFRNNHASSLGGAINNEGILNIKQNIFTSNIAGNSTEEGSGGAIINFGILNIESGQFNNNQASMGMGGAIENKGGTTTITSTNFTSNVAGDENGGSGGAISNHAKLKVVQCKFSSNQAGEIAGYGGGGAIINCKGLTEIIGGTFTSNVGGKGGGAIYNLDSLSIADSIFTNNRADQFGGAIVNSENITLTNVNASGNSADYGGFIDNGAYNDDPITCSVSGGVFSGNSADISGGAFYNTNTSSVTINESKFIDNHAVQFGGGIFNKGNTSMTNINYIMGAPCIQGNSAKGGGAIYNQGNLNIYSYCAWGFESNHATDEGGAILNNNGLLRVTGPSFTSNVARIGGAISSKGADSNCTMAACYITGNKAEDGTAIANNWGYMELQGCQIIDNPLSNTNSMGYAIMNLGEYGATNMQISELKTTYPYCSTPSLIAQRYENTNSYKLICSLYSTCNITNTSLITNDPETINLNQPLVEFVQRHKEEYINAIYPNPDGYYTKEELEKRFNDLLDYCTKSNQIFIPKELIGTMKNENVKQYPYNPKSVNDYVNIV
jgi:predicted outer membrane repeat protein